MSSWSTGDSTWCPQLLLCSLCGLKASVCHISLWGVENNIKYAKIKDFHAHISNKNTAIMSANTLIDINVSKIATDISGLGIAIIIYYYMIVILV